jgi:hypothetical protein
VILRMEPATSNRRPLVDELIEFIHQVCIDATSFVPLVIVASGYTQMRQKGRGIGCGDSLLYSARRASVGLIDAARRDGT